MQIGKPCAARAGMERDYYSTLGVNRIASQQALKHAYRTRIREVHPDLHPADQSCADRARKVIEAYGVLQDAESRRHYDRALARSAPRVTMPVYACDGPCPLWLTRFVALLLFFALAAGAFYVVTISLGDNTPVFRPSLGINVAPVRHAVPAGFENTGGRAYAPPDDPAATMTHFPPDCASVKLMLTVLSLPLTS